jgi:hypothetical protein
MDLDTVTRHFWSSRTGLNFLDWFDLDGFRKDAGFCFSLGFWISFFLQDFGFFISVISKIKKEEVD